MFDALTHDDWQSPVFPVLTHDDSQGFRLALKPMDCTSAGAGIQSASHATGSAWQRGAIAAWSRFPVARDPPRIDPKRGDHFLQGEYRAFSLNKERIGGTLVASLSAHQFLHFLGVLSGLANFRMVGNAEDGEKRTSLTSGLPVIQEDPVLSDPQHPPYAIARRRQRCQRRQKPWPFRLARRRRSTSRRRDRTACHSTR